MFKDLIEYEDLQEASAELFGFSGVTMLRDFGPLIKGRNYETIWFDTETSVVQVYDDNNKLEYEFPFGIFHKNEPNI